MWQIFRKFINQSQIHPTQFEMHRPPGHGYESNHIPIPKQDSLGSFGDGAYYVSMPKDSNPDIRVMRDTRFMPRVEEDVTKLNGKAYSDGPVANVIIDPNDEVIHASVYTGPQVPLEMVFEPTMVFDPRSKTRQIRDPNEPRVTGVNSARFYYGDTNQLREELGLPKNIA